MRHPWGSGKTGARCYPPRYVNRFFRSALFPLVVIVLLVYLASQTLMPRRDGSEKMTYSQLIQATKNGDVSEADVHARTASRSRRCSTRGRRSRSTTHRRSRRRSSRTCSRSTTSSSTRRASARRVVGAAHGFLPFVLLIGFWIFLMNQMQGGGSKVMSFGKSRAKRMSPDSPKVTYKDVAGADEAVEELQEIKEFLENPKKFQALGARIPKGVLLYGPPGTGKTLLARATAGEAGVPFFSISGSDFVEMFVGVGTSVSATFGESGDIRLARLLPTSSPSSPRPASGSSRNCEADQEQERQEPGQRLVPMPFESNLTLCSSSTFWNCACDWGEG